MIAWLSCLQWD